MRRRVLKTNPGLVNLTLASRQAASVAGAVRATSQHVGNTGAGRQISALPSAAWGRSLPFLQLCGAEPATVVVQHPEVPQHMGLLLQACEGQGEMNDVTEKW